MRLTLPAHHLLELSPDLYTQLLHTPEPMTLTLSLPPPHHHVVVDVTPELPWLRELVHTLKHKRLHIHVADDDPDEPYLPTDPEDPA